MENDHMKLLNEEDEEKVTGGVGVTKEEILGRFGFDKSNLMEPIEVECSFCHEKYSVPRGLVDFSCPHCGYGGYKSIDSLNKWFEKHKN